MQVSFDFDFTIKIDDVLRAFFSTILLIPQRVAGKFNETSNQFLNSVFEERFVNLYFVTTVVYKLIEDFLERKYKDNQRLKYHLTYLVYRIVNSNVEYSTVEKYFKTKNTYYESEQDYFEKKTEDYENAGKVANHITSNLFKLIKDKDKFYDFLEITILNLQSKNPEFFADFSVKQNEAIIYKAVRTMDFDSVINYGYIE